MIGVLSLQNRSVFMGDGGDNVLHLMSVYLVFTRCGRVWSLDARRAERARQARARGEHVSDRVGPVLWAVLGFALVAVTAGGRFDGADPTVPVILWGVWLAQAVWWLVGRRATRGGAVGSGPVRDAGRGRCDRARRTARGGVQGAQLPDARHGPLPVDGLHGQHRHVLVVGQVQPGPRGAVGERHGAHRLPRQVAGAADVADLDDWVTQLEEQGLYVGCSSGTTGKPAMLGSTRSTPSSSRSSANSVPATITRAPLSSTIARIRITG